MELKLWMKKHRWRLSELSKKLGVNNAWLSNVVRGKSKPGLKLALKIYLFTEGKVGLLDFFTEEEIQLLGNFNEEE